MRQKTGQRSIGDHNSSNKPGQGEHIDEDGNARRHTNTQTHAHKFRQNQSKQSDTIPGQPMVTKEILYLLSADFPMASKTPFRILETDKHIDEQRGNCRSAQFTEQQQTKHTL
jgi:hypothetical protein